MFCLICSRSKNLFCMFRVKVYFFVLKNLNIILNSGVFRIKIYPTEVFSVFRIPIYCVHNFFCEFWIFTLYVRTPNISCWFRFWIYGLCASSQNIYCTPTLAYIGHVIMTNTTHRKHCPVSTSQYQHLPERTPRLWWAHIIRTEDKICFTFTRPTRHAKLFFK